MHLIFCYVASAASTVTDYGDRLNRYYRVVKIDSLLKSWAKQKMFLLITRFYLLFWLGTAAVSIGIVHNHQNEAAHKKIKSPSIPYMG